MNLISSISLHKIAKDLIEVVTGFVNRNETIHIKATANLSYGLETNRLPQKELFEKELEENRNLVFRRSRGM